MALFRSRKFYRKTIWIDQDISIRITLRAFGFHRTGRRRVDAFALLKLDRCCSKLEGMPEKSEEDFPSKD